MLEGEAGVGKTALWRRALEAAAASGWRILTSAPAGSEVRLAFAALGDLLDLVIDDALPALPGPQRRVLEVALLRDEPVLVLATRRLEGGLSAPLELERILGDERVQRLRVGPLSLGGVHELLVARLGLNASRSTLVRLQEFAGGNPFYSLEIGRELIARGGEPAPAEGLPVPGSVRGLVQARLARLSPVARTVLLAAAALARPTRAILSQLEEHADAGLDEAVAAGLVGLSNSERVRFAHSLFASVHTSRRRWPSAGACTLG